MQSGDIVQVMMAFSLSADLLLTQSHKLRLSISESHGLD